MSETLLEITEQLASGLFPDLKGRSAPLWLDGVNVFFEFGQLKGGLGQTLIFDTGVSDEILGITSMNLGGIPTILYGTAAKIFRWDETNGAVDITNLDGDYTGTSNDLWKFEQWGNFITATNNIDPPQILKAAEFEDMDGLDSITTVSCFVEQTPHMLGFGTSIDPREIIWSAIDDVEEYQSNGLNSAGGLPIRGLNSEIRSAKKLGEVIALYSSDEMRAVSYIRAPYIFGVRPRLSGFGLVGRSALVDVGARHFGFSPRGIWVTDGIEATYITPGIVQNFIYNNINKLAWGKVVGYHDRSRSMVIFYYPTKESSVNNRGVGYNYLNQTFTLFNYGRSAAVDNSIFDYGITGDVNGNLFFTADNAPTYGGQNAKLPIGEVLTGQFGHGIFGCGYGGCGGRFT